MKRVDRFTCPKVPEGRYRYITDINVENQEFIVMMHVIRELPL